MRLATFNILHGRSLHDDAVVPERLAAAVRELDPDILALQEVDRDQPRSNLADLTAVAAAAMGAQSQRFVAALSGTPGVTWEAATGREAPGTAAYGLALLSRYPVRAWQVLRMPRIPFRFPFWLREPGRMVMVKEEPRTAVVATLETPHGVLSVANTHLSFVPGWNRRQLRRIRTHLAALDDPVILMGDLNLPAPLHGLLPGYRNLVSAPTFPLENPDRQIDHIMLRGSLPRPISAANPLLPLSDHRALVIDIPDPEVPS